MDIGTIATDLSIGNVAQGVTIGALRSVLNLEQVVGAQLAAALGIGTNIDAYA
jgi:hypothetical protein